MIQLENLQSLTTSAFRKFAYFGRIILLVASLGVGFAALSSVHTRPASAAGSAPVTVMNTPLPVQGSVSVNNFPATQTVSGTVSVGNTPNVNLANTPTVNLAGGSSVNVSNPLDSQSNPTPLVTLEAAQPYEDSCDVGLPPGGQVGVCIFNAAPTGKRLVIQEVDVSLVVDPGLRPTYLSVYANGVYPHYLTATFMGSTVGPALDIFATHQETHLYVNKFQTPSCNISLSGPAVKGYMQCDLSGFLVDAP
jgi:hypothetical protein